MRSTIEIAGRPIGPDQPPYVIAEVSGNHNGEITKALRLIEVAKDAGADAVKLQTYTADTLTIDSDRPDFRIEDGLWEGRTLYELYEWAHTPWEWHERLFERARELDLTIFSSPFDSAAVDLLEELNAPAHKIASFEAIDHELISYAARTGKPLIISTGMADADEISDAVQVVQSVGGKKLALLHCVSGYPAPAEDYNLRTIPDMRERFGVPIGLSDHTLDNITAVAAVAVGACIVEKHFTLDRSGGGPDDAFSLEPQELSELCQSTRTAWDALGSVDYGRKSSETGNLKFRRSLYFVRDLAAGSVLTFEDVRSIRPGYGLPPKDLPQVLGATVTTDIRSGTPVDWDLLSSPSAERPDGPR